MDTDIDNLIAPSLALGRKLELPDHSFTADHTRAAEKQPRVHAVRIGNLGLILNTEETISEVFNELPICRLPNTSDCLHGICNQRGNMVPIFNMESILGIHRQDSTEPAKYLLFGQREKAVGILIYELPVRLLLKSEEKLDRTPAFPSLLQAFAGNSYQINDQIWVEWDIFGFFHSVSEQISA